MKKLWIIVMLATTVSLSACGEKKDKPTEEDYDDLTQTEKVEGVEVNEAGGYGKVISTDGAIELASLVADMEKADGFSGKVKGTVVASCQNKGCWMTLDGGDGNTMMVSFKDYGFFVPMDMAGKEVVIEGTAAIKEVSVDELRHLAEDAGKSAAEIEAITAGKEELSFVADGVMVVG